MPHSESPEIDFFNNHKLILTVFSNIYHNMSNKPEIYINNDKHRIGLSIGGVYYECQASELYDRIQLIAQSIPQTTGSELQVEMTTYEEMIKELDEYFYKNLPETTQSFFAATQKTPEARLKFVEMMIQVLQRLTEKNELQRPEAIITEVYAYFYENLPGKAQNFFAPTQTTPESRLKFVEMMMQIDERKSMTADELRTYLADIMEGKIDDADWDLDILKGVVDGHLSPHEASTMLLLKECIKQDPKATTIRLKNTDGTVNREAAQELSKYLFYGEMTKKTPLFQNEQALMTALEALPDDPLLLSTFFLMEPEPLPEGRKESFTIQSTCRNNLGPVQMDGKFAVIPPKILNALLRARCGENAAELDPVIGGVSPAIRFEREVLRDGLVPCDRLFLEKEVHDLPSSPLGIYAHDAYVHLFMTSAFPLSVRKQAITFARQIQDLKNTKEFKGKEQQLDEAYNAILDLESVYMARWCFSNRHTISKDSGLLYLAYIIYRNSRHMLNIFKYLPAITHTAILKGVPDEVNDYSKVLGQIAKRILPHVLVR